MKTYSITGRLIWMIVLVELCSTLALVISAGVYEGFSHFRSFDVMLHGRADSMLGAVQDAEDPQDNVMLDGTQAFAPRRDIYAVRDERGRMLGHSTNWQDPLSEFHNATEYHNIRLNGRSYRVIRLEGLRMVDPGDKGGGIARHVVILYGAPTDPVWKIIRNTVSFYALLSLLLLDATVLILLHHLRKGLEPLAELAAKASGISSDSWEFSPSNNAREIRELAPLVAALETTLARLQRSFEQQRRFVSDAAHELKTSVAVVKSSLQVLMMKERKVQEYRAGLTRAEEDCERMEELAVSMLTLAGIEAPERGSRNEEPVNLNELVNEVNEHFRPAAEIACLTMHTPDRGSVWVSGERDKLRLLVSNLLHNAIQHSEAGGEVRTVLDAAGGMAELRIEDDGEGIAPEILPFVFDRFFRGDVSRSRRTGGTGLGLAIVRAIVQEMNGQIRIESELHYGTRVFVSLPLSSASHP